MMLHIKRFYQLKFYQFLFSLIWRIYYLSKSCVGVDLSMCVPLREKLCVVLWFCRKVDNLAMSCKRARIFWWKIFTLIWLNKSCIFDSVGPGHFSTSPDISNNKYKEILFLWKTYFSWTFVANNVEYIKFSLQ